MRGAWRVPAVCLLVAGAALLATSSARADTTSEAHIPLAEWFTNPCAGGESGWILGEMHALVSMTNTHSTLFVNWQFSKGLSVDGTIYEGNEVHSVVLSEPKGGFTIEITDNYELVSQSSSPNLIVRMRVVLTFDPMTQTFQEADRSTIECSGPG
jgi:hypothetical protein